MSTAYRLAVCRLLEKMEKDREYGRRLGLSDESVYSRDKKQKEERR